MNTVNLIKKKRAGENLTKEELNYLVSGYVNNEIPDYQMSAFLMAVCFQGMSKEETATLVDLMQHSGKVVNLSRIKQVKVDKHSTGGIGDKTTMILAPLLASCGMSYPTIAGRGLAHTGGTVDKLEAIPGFSCNVSLKRFEELVATVGLAFIGQTDEICPADKKIYALRDVTGTVESLPLIVTSILSKKLAEGADALVFDVKYGSGAFMKSKEQAVELAKALVETGKAAGREASALITDMSEPLGHAVGNAIEMNECVAFLRRGPQDPAPHPKLEEITLALATELLALGRKREKKPALSTKEARELLEENLKSGHAYAKLLEIVSMQGGDTEALDHGLPLASKTLELKASATGFITEMNAEAIGWALVDLGGGRHKASDRIDPSVGFWFEKFVGDSVKKGDVVARIYAKDAKAGEAARKALEAAVGIGPEKMERAKLIVQKI